MSVITLYWLVFIAIFLIVYTIDMIVTSYKKGTISLKSSLARVNVWGYLSFCHIAEKGGTLHKQEINEAPSDIIKN